MTPKENLIASLKILCDREGGYVKVADEIGANDQSIWQIISGVKLPSGEPRGVGPQLQKRLSARYPGWADLAQRMAVSEPIDTDESDVGDVIAIKSRVLLPLVGEVKGGADGYLEELQYPVGHGEGVVEYPTSDPNAYALRVRGDSMHPRYRAGEFVIVEPNIEPQPGDDVVVLCTNGRKMLKQLNWRRDGEVQLLSINNGYAPLTIPMSEVESIQLATGRGRRSALKKPGHV